VEPLRLRLFIVMAQNNPPNFEAKLALKERTRHFTRDGMIAEFFDIQIAAKRLF
jgi:hypothetical protein